MENTKIKGYVVVEKPLTELEQMAGAAQMYSSVSMYECKIDRSNLSEGQKVLQGHNRWCAHKSATIDLYDNHIAEIVEKIAYEELFNGCREGLEKKVFDRIMNSNVRAIAYLISDSRGEDTPPYRLDTEIEIDNEKSDKFEYSYDIEEFEKKLEDVAYRSSYMASADPENVYLEEFEVSAYLYRFNNIREKISKEIKKFIKKELTYCIKSDKVVISEEYLAKGKDGIREWREIKSAGNKNNSMEKRMLRQIITDKKIYAFDAMEDIIHGIAKLNNDWSIPTLEIEGRWNKSKVSKLVGQVMKCSNKQEFIDKSEEDIVKEFRECWKGVLKKAYDEVDKIEIIKRERN